MPNPHPPRIKPGFHPLRHLHTINRHKWLVLKYCFKCGLYWQGLIHDLSKYSPVEFWAGARYWQGNMSPNNVQRMEKGYSAAWLHHKGRNKHHLEYWIDYDIDSTKGMVGMRMPDKYVCEMICDRIAASKTYQGEKYRQEFPWKYYLHGRDHYLLHPEVKALLEKLLQMLRDEGEDVTFAYMKREVLHKGTHKAKPGETAESQ